MNDRGPLTPKEFADLVFDGKRSARWVRRECRRYVKSKGRRGIAVIARVVPYLIPRSEVTRWSMAEFAKSA